MDTFLGRNARTFRTKVRQVARRGEQKERTRGRGARVTESIVEAYWESANSPGFNLTGEPWTPFNIQARARRLVVPRKLLQRNRHVKHLEARCHSRWKPELEERRRREKKLSGYSILAELSSNIFDSRDIPRYPVTSMYFEFFLSTFLSFFPSFILRHFSLRLPS